MNYMLCLIRFLTLIFTFAFQNISNLKMKISDAKCEKHQKIKKDDSS